MSAESLPDSWLSVPMSELVVVVRGVTYKKDESSNVPEKGLLPVLRANNIQEGKLIFNDFVYVPSEKIADHQKVRVGDIVVAMSSGSKNLVGKSARAYENWDGGFGAFCGILRPDEDISKSYVSWFTYSGEYRKRVSELSAGVNINNLKPSHFNEIQVPVAPLAEQKKIATKLDELLAQVDTIKINLAAIPTILKCFRQSVLAAAVSGRLTEKWRKDFTETTSELVKEIGVNRLKLWLETEQEKYTEKGRVPPANYEKNYKPPKQIDSSNKDIPQSWTALTWSHVSMWITYGFTKPMPHVEDGPLIVTAKNVRHSAVLLENVHKTTREAFNGLRPKDKPREGDILIVKDGATTGRSCLAPGDIGEYCISQSVAVVWLKYSPMNREYLLWCVQSEKTQRRIQEVMAGMAMPHLSITDFGKMIVLIPHVREQEEIVIRVNQLLTFADQIEQQVKDAQSHINNLTYAILAKAFRGDLTAEWREQNPGLISGENSAEVLLGRIKAKRQSVTLKKQTRKKRA